MAERSLSVDHVTIWRWVQRYAPVLNQRMRREMRRPNRSWRVDETYVKVAGNWAYLYRVVDSAGETIEFMLSPKLDLTAAKLFLRLSLSRSAPSPRVINVDGHPAYASTIAELKQSGELGRRCYCRTAPYLNSIIEQAIALSRSGSRRASAFFRRTGHGERLRGLLGDARHPQRSGPVGRESRSRGLAPIHPHNLRHRRIALTQTGTSLPPRATPVCNRTVRTPRSMRLPQRFSGSGKTLLRRPLARILAVLLRIRVRFHLHLAHPD